MSECDCEMGLRDVETDLYHLRSHLTAQQSMIDQLRYDMGTLQRELQAEKTRRQVLSGRVDRSEYR